MSRIQKLYESMILEHNKNPRNFKEMTDCTHQSHGHNPLCGDDYFVYIKVKDDRLEDISFQGQGCAISKSSGSLMTEFLKGKSLDECKAVKDLFLNCCRSLLYLFVQEAVFWGYGTRIGNFKSRSTFW